MSIETTITIAPQFLEEPEPAFEKLFAEVTLICRASGVPPPIIKWYKDDGPDPISFEGTYIIDQVQLPQRGQYYCTAENVVNTITSTRALVNIIGNCDNILTAHRNPSYSTIQYITNPSQCM